MMYLNEQQTLNNQISRLGYAGPFDLLNQSEILETTAEYARLIDAHPELNCSIGDQNYWDKVGTDFIWFKSLHDISEQIADIAKRTEILSKVQTLLGDNLKLWGSEIIIKSTGKSHRWHVDAEAWEWPSLNVWVGLENVSKLASLKIVPGSHLYVDSLQELAEAEGIDLNNDQAVLKLAKTVDANAEVKIFDIQPGQFYIFEGKTWHGSDNSSGLTRSSLLLQYSNINAEVKIPRTFSPPFQWLEFLPPCLYL